MKAKIICLAMVLAVMVAAILVPSLALAGGTGGGTAVPRVLSVSVTPVDGVVINWVGNVTPGGYYYDSEGVTVKNIGNVPCDIELRGADAVISGGDWTLWQTITDLQLNIYNLGWVRLGSPGVAWLHSGNYVLIGNDVPIGGTLVSCLQMRTPAAFSNTGAFTIATHFRAVPHTTEVSPLP